MDGKAIDPENKQKNWRANCMSFLLTGGSDRDTDLDVVAEHSVYGRPHSQPRRTQ